MEPATATDDRQFREWIGAGELRRAGEWLVRRHAGEVVGLCAAMVRDRNVAEDLAQDVFGRAFASLARFRGDASPRTWLLSIARNHCIDHLRAHQRDPWRGPAHDEDDAEPDIHPDEAPLPPDLLLQRADVEQALAELAEAERALVTLRFGHGLSYGELAGAFGLREGTVRMRISRALARMRRALETTEPQMQVARLEADGAAAEGFAEEQDVPPPSGAPAPAPASRQRAPAPVASASHDSSAGPRAAGFVGRLRSAFGGGGEPPEPAPQPLGEALRQLAPAPSDALIDGLVRRAQAL